MKAVFIGWTEHGRSRELAEVLGAEEIVITSRLRPVLARYASSSARTMQLLLSMRPRAVVFMQPPAPLLLTVWLYSLLVRPHPVLIADLHSGFFNDKRWSWFKRPAVRLLKHHVAIVTNDRLAELLPGVREVVVMHDPLNLAGSAAQSSGRTRVLFPLSYAADEPTQEILEAARLLEADQPSTQLWLTGRAPSWMTDVPPPNVHFTGFLSNEHYAEVLRASTVVVALTTRNYTMQRAAYEALEVGVPIVTSDFDVLRDFFEDGAQYVEPTAKGIAGGIRAALADLGNMRRVLPHVAERRLAEQNEALTRLQSIVSEASRDQR